MDDFVRKHTLRSCSFSVLKLSLYKLADMGAYGTLSMEKQDRPLEQTNGQTKSRTDIQAGLKNYYIDLLSTDL